MMRPLSISVALCTRNGERFVAQQLESVLRQTKLPEQIVLSDDASEDATLEIVDDLLHKFRKTNPGIAIDFLMIRNDRPLGVTKNFEQAIRACTRDLVALCDQDDIWVGNRLLSMAEQFAARPDLILLHSDALLIDELGLPTGTSLFKALEISVAVQNSIHRGDAFDELLRRNLVTGACTMFRRSLMATAAPFPASWLHDEWLAIVAAATGVVDFLPSQLTGYRQHDSNEVGASAKTFVAKLAQIFESGTNRNTRLFNRALDLDSRISSLTTDDSKIYAVKEKLAHEQIRSGLSAARVTRIPTVAREFKTGRYSSFGRGYLDAARDLFQPLRANG